MPHNLWSPGFIGSVCLKNRIIRSAVNDAQADPSGACTPVQIALLRDLVSHGVGAIITGHIYVHCSGMAGNRQLGLDRDELIPQLAQMPQAVHEGNGVIFAQLSHAGNQADTYLTGLPPTGPSSVIPPGGHISYPMSVNDIRTIVEAFAMAAKRAKKAGFDGVQLHAAHGYCLSEFLSPGVNKRTDAYGGSVQKRARLLLEVCRAVREEVGRDYPLFIKIDGEDFHENGLTREMMCETVQTLDKENLLDAVEVSGFWGRFKSRHDTVDSSNPGTEAYVYRAALDFKKCCSLPLILVGGIRSLNAARSLVERDHVDFVAMARPFIKDPWLVHTWWTQEQGQSDRPQSEKSDG